MRSASSLGLHGAESKDDDDDNDDEEDEEDEEDEDDEAVRRCLAEARTLSWKASVPAATAPRAEAYAAAARLRFVARAAAASSVSGTAAAAAAAAASPPPLLLLPPSPPWLLLGPLALPFVTLPFVFPLRDRPEPLPTPPLPSVATSGGARCSQGRGGGGVCSKRTSSPASRWGPRPGGVSEAQTTKEEARKDGASDKEDDEAEDEGASVAGASP